MSRRRKSKRKKLVPMPRLMRDAVSAFNGWIRRRDFACMTCGTTKKPTASHLITARRVATRFSEIGVVKMCRDCNMRHEFFPELMTSKWLKQYGLVAYHNLVAESLKPKKYKRHELENIIQTYLNK